MTLAWLRELGHGLVWPLLSAFTRAVSSANSIIVRVSTFGAPPQYSVFAAHLNC